MITYINFAVGEPYEKFRKYNSWTAKKFGKVDTVIEYKKDDIPKAYIDSHIDIFSKKRGMGLWLWKPYFIDKTLNELNNGDWLFYVDSGAIIINDVHKLIDCAEKQEQDIMTFEMPLIDHQFTKKECYEVMGITDYTQNQLAATYILVKKTVKSVRFIQEWLKMCENECMLSPEHFNKNIKEFPDFVAHREDQSLLTLMRIKYGIPPFRDCSDYGETPHMYFSSHYGYNAKEYPNSTYPTIVLSNRRKNPFVYFVRYEIKRLLRWLGFNKPETIIKTKIEKGL